MKDRSAYSKVLNMTKPTKVANSKTFYTEKLLPYIVTRCNLDNNSMSFS